jgi:hypothetical protein
VCVNKPVSTEIQRKHVGELSNIAHRDTVAGDAVDKSSTSNMISTKGDNVMISPDTKHSFLLSSSNCNT